MLWGVRFTNKAKKQAENLPPKVRETLFALVLEMRELGPVRTAWLNYGKKKGKKNCHHCHLKKGKPTYVAIWKVTSKESRLVEVRYVGTHEKTDYGQIC